MREQKNSVITNKSKSDIIIETIGKYIKFLDASASLGLGIIEKESLHFNAIKNFYEECV